MYLLPFCSSKLAHFFKFSFRESRSWRMSVFLSSKCLTCLYLTEHPLKVSNKRTHIPLLINLFISLIELKHQLKYQIKGDMCRFKIDKITQSKSQSRTTYEVIKIKPLVYFFRKKSSIPDVRLGWKQASEQGFEISSSLLFPAYKLSQKILCLKICVTQFLKRRKVVVGQ